MSSITISGRLRVYDVAQSVLDRRLQAPLSDVELSLYARRGLARATFGVQNLVTDLGLSAISRLLGFGLSTPTVTNGTDNFGVADINDLLIDTMSFGNLDAPTAPTAADNDLEDATVLTSVTPTVTYPGNALVRWSGVIPANTLTGQQVTEEALFCANGALVARTTFPAQAIVAGFGKQFDHEFVIARV